MNEIVLFPQMNIFSTSFQMIRMGLTLMLRQKKNEGLIYVLLITKNTEQMCEGSGFSDIGQQTDQDYHFPTDLKRTE